MPLDTRDSSRVITRLPFIGAAALAWVAVLADTSIDWPLYAVSATVAVVSGGLSGARCEHRFSQLPAAFSFLAAIALLRASAGGMMSGVGALALVPVFYVALYDQRRRSLLLVIAGVAMFFLAPMLLIGAPGYPPEQWRGTLLTLAVSAVVGLATQRLVAGVRGQADDASRREQMLVRVGGAVRALLSSDEPRSDICRAALEISDAQVAILFEPEPEPGGVVLHRVAMTGGDYDAAPLAISPGDAIATTMRAGRARLLGDAFTRAVAGDQLWEACGRPHSLLYQPLARGEATVGVLVVGWGAEVPVTDIRQTVVELLAHEGGLVIDRADELTLLTGMAETDALTGLANRRAWDARLTRVAIDDEPVAVAVLDIDHFKRFNDSCGHPAGDRLLRETAAAWRDLLRTDDMLARLGGEEFGVLLFDCTQADAADVTERLRQCVTQGQTASAGLAVRRPGEPLDSVLGRADHALYDVKAYGRDHSRTAA